MSKNASNDISFEGIVQYKSYDSSNEYGAGRRAVWGTAGRGPRPAPRCRRILGQRQRRGVLYGCRSRNCPPSAAAAQAMKAPMIIDSAVKIEAAALALRAASAA
jgi:hypothetical protein